MAGYVPAPTQPAPTPGSLGPDTLAPPRSIYPEQLNALLSRPSADMIARPLMPQSLLEEQDQGDANQHYAMALGALFGLSPVNAVAQAYRDARNGDVVGGIVQAGLALAPFIGPARGALRELRSVLPEARYARVGSSRGYDGSPNMEWPFEKPQRPFEIDYPRGAPHDAGRLLQDVDGREIAPTALVVGRRLVGEADAPVSAAELVARAQERLGFDYSRATRRKPGEDWESTSVPGPSLASDTFGEFRPRVGPGGELRGHILYDRDLAPSDAEHVLTHETAHGLDYLAPLPPPEPLNVWERIYSDLNQAGRQRLSVADRGYSPDDYSSELWAEAIRAYIQDPNYLKTVAPDVARAIRDTFNTSPRIAPHLHFNQLLPPLAIGAGALGLATQWHPAPSQ